MIVKSLKLRNFRNYESASVVFAPGMNLIVGRNAQGKTNLLESLIYLSLTRSHRISDDTQLIRHGAEFADISCVYEDEMERQIEAVIQPAGKTLMIRRQPVKKSSEFIGLLNVVLFAPDDLHIFHDQPRDRRRIMNQEITKISGSYLNALNRYQTLLRQRNIVLKQLTPDQQYLDTLAEQMVKEEVEIIRCRRQFAAGINSSMLQLYQELAGGASQASLQYHACTDAADEALAAELQKMYQNTNSRDIEMHMTGSGVHRDDLIFELDGSNVIQTASQGQKRMVMLAFKLALLRYIQQQSGKSPVLLLDDVLSELDLPHQQKLIAMVQKPCQCLITATEIPAFLNQQHPTVYQIANGMINPLAGGNQ